MAPMLTGNETSNGVPGTYGPPIVGRLVHTLNFGLDWRGFLAKRRSRYQSTVFRTHVGVKAITIVDPDAINVLFDMDKVRKPYGFGPRVPPPPIVAGTCPTAFTDGEQHRGQKALYMSLMQQEEDSLMETFDRMAAPSFDRWTREGEFDLSQALADQMADFFFPWVLGVRVPHDDLQLWVANAIPMKVVPVKDPKKKSAKVRGAFDRLAAAVRASPRFREIAEAAREPLGLDEVSLSHDLVFTLVINGWAGMTSFVRSIVAELTRHPMRAADLRYAIASAGRLECIEDVMTIEPLDHFLKEVLRLHPPVPITYGVARKDMVLEARTGKYPVRAGELLMGVIEAVQTDPHCYERPNEFWPERFADPAALEHLYWSGGPINVPCGVDNKQCAGRDQAEMIGALFTARLLTGYRWELTERPEWKKPLSSGNVANTPLKASLFARLA